MPDYNNLLNQLNSVMDGIKADADAKSARKRAADEATVETARKLAEIQDMIAESDRKAEQRAAAQSKSDKSSRRWQVAAVFIGIATLLATILFGIKAWLS